MSEISHQRAFQLIHKRNLNDAEKSRLQDHLQRCPECRLDAKIAGFLDDRLVLKALPTRPSPQFTAGYMQSARRRSWRSQIMKPVYAVGGAVVLVLLVLAGWFLMRPDIQSLQTAAEPTAEAVVPDRGRMEVVNVPSPSLADAIVLPMESKDVFVYLPPGYDTSEKSYPVIYTMPSGGFSEFQLQEGSSSITDLLDGLWTDGTLPTMMFVFCEELSFAVNSSFQGDAPGFCAKDVVAAIDANYRTLDAPAGRGLLGNTQAGDAALRMAMTYPDVFSAVYINHPWVLAEGTLEDTYFTEPSVVEAMLGFADKLKDVPPDEVGTVYPEIVDEISLFETGFTLEYAMQYMAEPEPPYFSYLYTDVDTPADPEVWNRWEAGAGDLEERVAQGKEGLMQLAGLGIGRGDMDFFAPWAVPGTDELQRVLSESSIPHQWDEYAGSGLRLRDQLGPVIMPFFAEHLETEPGS